MVLVGFLILMVGNCLVPSMALSGEFRFMVHDVKGDAAAAYRLDNCQRFTNSGFSFWQTVAPSYRSHLEHLISLQSPSNPG
jgi:hypothetical protein